MRLSTGRPMLGRNADRVKFAAIWSNKTMQAATNAGASVACRLHRQVARSNVEAQVNPHLELVRPGRHTTQPMLTSGAVPHVDPYATIDVPPVLGPYRVIGLIACGGMGGVYLGEHALTGERVALKVLAPHLAVHGELVARMFGELEVSRRARHHGLVKIRDQAVSSEGVPYLVMELVDGENLASLLERGRIEIGAIAAIGAQVADALAAMHERGIVHCDLKPDNVIVMYQHGLAGWPEVKVVDFGVARFLDRPADLTVAGTPAYMAPEQWAGQVQARTDVYALGCFLYELLVGATPFCGTVAEMAAAHGERLPSPPSTLRSGVPVELEDLILRMLAKDPGMRPRMAELTAALTDLAYATPPGARVLHVITLAS